MQGGSSLSIERLRAAWGRRRWLALAVFSLVAALGFALALGLPNVYRATATVLVEQPRGEAAAAPGELDARLQLINQEILSRSRLEALVARFGLYPRLRGRASGEALAAQMRRDIRTDFKSLPQAGGGGSTIGFTLAYRGGDPRTVAQVANALAAFYVEQDALIRERQTSGAVSVMSAQLEEIKRDLERQERALADYQEQHVGELPQHADANLAAMSRLHADLRSAGELKARALDRRDELLRGMSDPASGPAPGPDAGAARLERAQQELAGLRQRYSDKHPDVVQKKAELETLARQDDAPAPAVAAPPRAASGRAQQALASLEEDIRGFKADEARLRGEIAAYAQRIENAPLRQRAVQEISRDYQATRDLYDSVRRRYDQAQLESEAEAAREMPRFRIVDAAVVPLEPVAPNRMVLLVVAMIAALAVAAGAAALAERLDSSFHSADDVRAYTRVPVLASIPVIVTASDRRRRLQRAGLALAAVLLALATTARGVHHLARGQESLVALLARS
jgi:polysaccharide chain length determinant protein (PEP-CTERM system associated)